jgi:hypothetical protein
LPGSIQANLTCRPATIIWGKPLARSRLELEMVVAGLSVPPA